jgi:predicted ATPase
MQARTGRLAEGLAVHQEAMPVYDRAHGLLYPHFLVQHDEILLLAMQVDAAGERTRQALDLTRERGERGCEAYVLRLLGEIAASADRSDLETSHGLYEQASRAPGAGSSARPGATAVPTAFSFACPVGH